VATSSVLIDKLLATVIQLKASDLHITVGQPPVIRHHGRMRRLDTKTLDNDDTTALMKSITPDRCQQELQEKGGSDFAIEFTDGCRFRTAIFKQRGSIGMVMRRIPSQFLTFEQLDMPDAIKRLITRPRGLLLVTGPTGSGKTTTLYSTLKTLATPEVNVCTIEDPIEMVEPAFNQMQVQPAIELGFAEGVRALMRQDPDIIMVGEIRDLETAEMAVQSALTGHLVLSTLHTNDAPSAVARLLELGVAPYLLNATLNGIMAQRLVRTLCPHCKQKVDLQRGEDQEAWDAMVAPWKANRPAKVCKPVGCLECRMTGYLGRVGIYETLVFTGAIKSLTAKNSELSAVREQAMKEGMKPLRISGAMKVAAGVTTIDEVLKVAPPIRDASTG